MTAVPGAPTSEPSGPSEVEMAVLAIRASLDDSHAAREEALPLTRRAIRQAANCIRAAHRAEFDSAADLLDGARVDMQAATEVLRSAPAVYHAGFLHDAQKEYAEAAITLAAIAGRPLPLPEALGVEGPAYLHGLAEAVGELRRHLLDALRADALDECEHTLALMDDIYAMLVTIDYPDALTNGLRRTTDVTRGILEKTRGDFSVAVQQQRLVRLLGRTGES